jgi:D-alanine-D-alanine ligase
MEPRTVSIGTRFRDTVTRDDPGTVRRIVSSTEFFSESELEVAVELVQERLNRGEASGYHFLFAENDGRTDGYSCFGPIACTVCSFDLYWIVVEREHQGRGIGRELLRCSEQAIARMGGRRIYVETSSRPQYEPTRQFYERCGYCVEALLGDFYAPGDGKVILVRAL